MSDVVLWWGSWKHAVCGTSSDDLFADGYSAFSGHDCEDEDDPAGTADDQELEAAS